MTSIHGLTLFRLLLLAAMAAPTFAVDQVTLHYNQRPPYQVTKNGQLSGLTGTPAVAALKTAGISFVIQETPSARQLIAIKGNTGMDCGIGWFKNGEREVFGKFTKPIYRDEPQIALASAKNAKLKSGDTLESILGNKSINLLVKQGYSYGKTLDALMERLQPIKNSVAVENVQMLQMINAGRADYMFAAPEEIDGLLAATGINPAEIQKITFSNAPKGEDRFILCSKKVSDEIITKLNGAIK